MRYTAVFEWPERQEPAVSKKDGWLGGELCAVQFSDGLEELERLKAFVDLCVECEYLLPSRLVEALQIVRPPDDEAASKP